MATAAGIPDQIAATARSAKNMEDCWESPAWDQTDNRTESHGTESGDFSADRTMEWVFKSAPWDLDSLLVFPPRLRDADKRLPNNDTSFPAIILEASVPAEEYGQKQRLDRSLIQGNSSFDSRGCKGEINGAIGPSDSGGHSDLKPSQAEQRSLPSTELASCSLSSGHSHGVFSRAQPNLKKDRGETQLMCTGGNYPHKLSLVYGRDVVTEKRRGRNEDAQSNGVNVEANADSVIGLKLGKRTYYKDSAGYVSGKPPTIISPSPPSHPAKKQRAQSQSAQIPRCQVEGCDLDLSSVKDYHRRHKVCDTHSKSPRVTVAGQEQRFCQQCSRFHVLSEFDEGKRSCRRRLAGHNERRRKPQQDSVAIALAGGISSYQDHGAWSYGSELWSKLQSMDDQLGFPSRLQIPGSERHPLHSSLSDSNADRLLMFLQNSKRHMFSMSDNASSEGTNPYMKHKMEHALSLSSTPGAEALAGLAGTQATCSFSGLSDSGCALSLLSSESWTPKPQSSVSFHLSGHVHVPFEQLMAENTHSLCQPGQPLSLSTQATQAVQAEGILTKDLLSMQVQLQEHLSTGKGLTTTITSSHKDSQQASCISAAVGMVGPYGNETMLSILHESDLKNSQHVNVLNLLQAPSSRWHCAQPSSESGELLSLSPQYMEIQSRRPFDSLVFDN